MGTDGNSKRTAGTNCPAAASVQQLITASRGQIVWNFSAHVAWPRTMAETRRPRRVAGNAANTESASWIKGASNVVKKVGLQTEIKAKSSAASRFRSVDRR